MRSMAWAPCTPGGLLEGRQGLQLPFEELSLSGAQDKDTIGELWAIFLNLTRSAILKHCHRDVELLSLCRTFLDLGNVI